MKLQVVVHTEPSGGFWAEVPALPGCVSQADTLEELMTRIREAAQGWLSVEPGQMPAGQVFEIAL